MVHCRDVILSCLLLAGSVHAQSFTAVSFNALHYGWGGNTAGKNSGMSEALSATKAAALVLQEVMPQATLANFQAGVPPPVGNWTFAISANSFGTGWYQERYAVVLLSSQFPTIGANLEFPALVGTFSRPPMGVPVIPQGSAGTYVIADFHAVWGRRKSQRTAEATAICASWLPAVKAALNPTKAQGIALAGDWNLTTAEVATNASACVSSASPSALTTLNRAGTDYSSSYDHAVQFNTGTMTLSLAWVYPVGNTVTWRAVSDHVPIAASFAYTP